MIKFFRSLFVLLLLLNKKALNRNIKRMSAEKKDNNKINKLDYSFSYLIIECNSGNQRHMMMNVQMHVLVLTAMKIYLFLFDYLDSLCFAPSFMFDQSFTSYRTHIFQTLF